MFIGKSDETEKIVGMSDDAEQIAGISNEVEQSSVSVVRKLKRKKTKQTKFRKAPQAPKRFKSPFILFSMKKHPEIRERLTKEEKSDVPNVAKLVAKEWRSLSDEDRAVWINMADKDKKRYEMEKTIYTGPWKIPAWKRSKKDPDAPKRPMSAFLAFSKQMRSTAKAENAELSNTDISKVLAIRWKEASGEVRATFIEDEAKQRKVYKIEISEWNDKKEKEFAGQRSEREAMAQYAVENGVESIPPEFRPHNIFSAQAGNGHTQMHMGYASGMTQPESVPHPHASMYTSQYGSYNASKSPQYVNNTANNPPDFIERSRLRDSSSFHPNFSHDSPVSAHAESHGDYLPSAYYMEGMGHSQHPDARYMNTNSYRTTSTAGQYMSPDWYQAEPSQYQAHYVESEYFPQRTNNYRAW